MRPTLLPGDRLLVDPRPALPIAPGTLVVVRDPERTGKLLVKRVGPPDDTAGTPPGGRERGTVFLVGDNPGPSRDSRHFGPVDRREILGVAWYRYAPPERRGELHLSLK